VSKVTVLSNLAPLGIPEKNPFLAFLSVEALLHNSCVNCVNMNINGKMRPAETIPGMGEEEDKGEWWRG
jgi:hypothetical protein